MLHVSALFEPSSGIHFKNYCFVLQFLSYCIGDPFCITNHNYCLYGVRCPLLFVFGGGGFFPLVNLPVVLVYGYGRGSCHLDFCMDVCLPDRRWASASVPLWCILILAGMVGFTRLGSLLYLMLKLTTLLEQNLSFSPLLME